MAPLMNDTLPLIRRSNKRNSAFGATETGTTKNNDNKDTMPSSSHLLDDNYSGGGGATYSSYVARGDDESRNILLGNGNVIGTTATDGSIIVSTTTAFANDNDLLGKSSSSSRSWVLLQRGRIILLLLSVVYGSLNISMRLVFARPEPPTASAASTIQGWIAAICFLPLLWKNHSNNNSYSYSNSYNNKNGWRGILAAFRKGQLPTQSIPITTSSSSNEPQQIVNFWRFALELAFFNFGTQALINISLLATQGARASFLVQMSVVFTPVVSVLFGQQKVSKRVWIACFVALAGLFVLSYSEEKSADDESSSSSNSASLTFTWGDWCCLMAALCWSLYIFRLSAWGEYFDETTTQFVKNVALAVLYSLWMLVSFASRWYFYNHNDQDNESDLQSTTTNATANASGNFSLWVGWRDDPIAWLILFYSALGPCTIADVFQQKAQSSVPAAEANVILSLEPVFTTLLGFLLLGEIPPVNELCGGLLIMIASVVASCGK